MRAWFAVLTPFLLLGIGAIGFKATGQEDQWTWFDAIYMSAITLTTVGYGETHPLTPEGRVFAMFFLFGGVFVLFFVATEVIRAIVSGQFRDALGRENVKQILAEIEDHVVVCGMGRMGRLVSQELNRHSIPFVAIDMAETITRDWPFEHGHPYVGDAADDEVLKRVGIERARTLVTVLPSDASNLYITLTARLLNPKLQIVARAEQEASEPKLRRVGANQVVSPYVIGGHRVAQAVLRPAVGQFLDQATRTSADAFHMEEIAVAVGSTLCGQSLRELDLAGSHGVVVITMRRPTGEMQFNPRGEAVVEAGSVLVVVGHRPDIVAVQRRAATPPI